MFSTDKSSFNKKDVSDCDYKISLAGNPNVGKSTIFNELTGLRQHTGNWTGKTVEFARGCCKIKDARFCITDLPGCYSLLSFSGEEAVTRECLIQNQNDCVVIVVDCGVIERNLSFALQVLSVTKNAVLCLNLCDEAEKNGIKIDCDELSLNLGIPVVKTCATDKKGLDELKKAIYNVCSGKIKCFRVERNFEGVDMLSEKNYKQNIEKLSQIGNKISNDCVKYEKSELNACTRKLDKILTSKTTGIPIMLAMLGILFWITVVGANYPSEWLGNLFGFIKEKLYILFDFLHAPDVVTGLLIDGVYTTLSWVVSVMLPPMAIFFPLFSLVEDSGYLPRIAFNLDRYFSKCGAHGKQSLSMAMGLGCNACGVTGCRIIESPKERLIATVTNNFMPCNGRFPMLIALITIFFSGSACVFASSISIALILVLLILFAVMMTMFVSKILSVTLLSGERSAFALELPPYRKPRILKTIVSSFLDRTLFVLGRAVIVAIPAGALIWLLANIYIADSSLLSYCTDFFDPFGRAIGLDGVIIMAFVLGFPANETVIPIIIMSYLSTGTLTDFASYEELFALLTQNGWTLTTAICTIVMCIFHFPCSTTCLTIKKETGSMGWTMFSIVMPTMIGIALCYLISHIM